MSVSVSVSYEEKRMSVLALAGEAGDPDHLSPVQIDRPRSELIP